MEQQIKLAAKLYRCRDSMQGLFGNEYHEKIKWYMEKLNAYSKNNDLDILKSVIDVCNLPLVKENGMASVLFLAAAVEILEPSKPPTTYQTECLLTMF
jgi:hypothetical protein